MQAYHLLTSEALAHPYPVYERLRSEDPVHWSERLKVWILTRYDDVVAVLRDPRVSAERLEPFARHQLRGLDLGIVADYLRVGNRQMLMNDGPRHTRLRRIASASFTKSALEPWRPIVQNIVDKLLDRVQARGRMELVADFAQPLPAIVIAERFGIAPEDRERFQHWSDGIATFFGGSFGNPEEDGRRANAAMRKLEQRFQHWSDGIATFFGGSFGNPEEDGRRANAAMRKLEQHFQKLIARRCQTPGDDLMSHLIAHQEQGRLDAEELIAQCVLLLVAGHVTTSDQMGNAVHTLLKHPEQLQKLRAQPALLDGAVEEILRFDSSVPFIHRIAREDLEIRGHLIAKGQVVFLGLASANHDPEQFSEPDRFDITRKPNRHLTFAVGPHVCLGAELARCELGLGLATLFRRHPQLRFTEPPPELRCDSLMFRGFKSMPLVF